MAKEKKLLISWNVNGIRAWAKKGSLDWMLKKSPDVFCLQETKAHPEQLSEEIRNPKGYVSHFDWSKTRKGYSGVAVYSKEQPIKVEYKLGIKELDQEGRLLIVHFKKFVLLNGYFPNGQKNEERLKYKLKYYKKFLAYVEKLKKQGKKIIFCGDINTAHHEIDLARPKENQDHTGFLPIERAWIDEVEKKGYIDTFRYFYPNTPDKYTFWDVKTRARDRNVGWRLDYFYVSSNLRKSLKKAAILDNVLGSDHCPITLEVEI